MTAEDLSLFEPATAEEPVTLTWRGKLALLFFGLIFCLLSVAVEYRHPAAPDPTEQLIQTTPPTDPCEAAATTAIVECRAGLDEDGDEDSPGPSQLPAYQRCDAIGKAVFQACSHYGE